MVTFIREWETGTPTWSGINDDDDYMANNELQPGYYYWHLSDIKAEHANQPQPAETNQDVHHVENWQIEQKHWHKIMPKHFRQADDVDYENIAGDAYNEQQQRVVGKDEHGDTFQFIYDF